MKTVPTFLKLPFNPMFVIPDWVMGNVVPLFRLPRKPDIGTQKSRKTLKYVRVLSRHW